MAVRIADIEALCTGLNYAGVRYLVVGGLAVIAHGYIRTTVDIDLVLDPDASNLTNAVTVLTGLDYRPRVPVSMESFVDADERKRWQDEKDMVVFTVIKGGGSGASEVDLFLEPPFDFAAAYSEAFWQDLPGGGRVPFVDLMRLIDMKQDAGRAKDLTDLDILRKLVDNG